MVEGANTTFLQNVDAGFRWYPLGSWNFQPDSNLLRGSAVGFGGYLGYNFLTTDKFALRAYTVPSVLKLKPAEWTPDGMDQTLSLSSADSLFMVPFLGGATVDAGLVAIDAGLGLWTMPGGSMEGQYPDDEGVLLVAQQFQGNGFIGELGAKIPTRNIVFSVGLSHLWGKGELSAVHPDDLADAIRDGSDVDVSNLIAGPFQSTFLTLTLTGHADRSAPEEAEKVAAPEPEEPAPAEPAPAPPAPGTAPPAEPGAPPAEPGAPPAEPGAPPAEPGVAPPAPGAAPPAPGAAPPAPGAAPPAPGVAPPAPGAAPPAPGGVAPTKQPAASHPSYKKVTSLPPPITEKKNPIGPLGVGGHDLDFQRTIKITVAISDIQKALKVLTGENAALYKKIVAQCTTASYSGGVLSYIVNDGVNVHYKVRGRVEDLGNGKYKVSWSNVPGSNNDFKANTGYWILEPDNRYEPTVYNITWYAHTVAYVPPAIGGIVIGRSKVLTEQSLRNAITVLSSL